MSLLLFQMRIVESDLKLKLDVREVKERFYALLKNFEAFEQRHPEYDVSRAPRPTAHRHRRTTGSSRRHSKMSSSGVGSMESSSMFGGHCPNNTAASRAGRWAPLPGSNDTAELTTAEYSHSRDSVLIGETTTDHVEDLSSITRCSNNTYREQFSQSRLMDVGGPLSSTMSYPQYSTPEKKRPSPADLPESILASPEQENKGRVQEVVVGTPLDPAARRRLPFASRPVPCGADAPAPPPPAAANHLLQRAGSDSDATPVAVRTAPRRLDYSSNDASTPHVSQHDLLAGSGGVIDLSLEPVTPLPRHLLSSPLTTADGRLRRQTAQPRLNDEPRAPLGLSETDLADPSSFFDSTMMDFQCSNNATRASVANLSALSVSSCTDSSYKESDHTTSSTASSMVAARRHGGKHQQDARGERFYSRHIVTMGSSQCTSGTSTSSCGGWVAPANSPNATSDSAQSVGPTIAITAPVVPSGSASRKMSRERSSSRRERSTHKASRDRRTLGARPACIGSDVSLLSVPTHALPPRAARAALSDPETSRLGVRVVAAPTNRRREVRMSGASSTSDQSAGSLGDTSKESTGSGPEVLPTPRSTSVRRSLSKRIRRLGKQLLRGSSKGKADAHQSA